LATGQSGDLGIKRASQRRDPTVSCTKYMAENQNFWPLRKYCIKKPQTILWKSLQEHLKTIIREHSLSVIVHCVAVANSHLIKLVNGFKKLHNFTTFLDTGLYNSL